MTDLVIFQEQEWKRKGDSKFAELVPVKNKFRLCSRSWDGYDHVDYDFIKHLTFGQAITMVREGLAADYTSGDILTDSKRPRYKVKALSKKVS